MDKTSFAKASTPTKVVVILLSAVQVGLLGAAHWDISHRSPEELNGSKVKWRLISLINFAGPLWYFLRGRNHSVASSS